jgi:hypothetical protein
MVRISQLFFCLLGLWWTTVLSGQQPPEHYGPYGGAFTPRGDLRALLVFVRFREGTEQNPQFTNQGQSLEQWTDLAGHRGLPDYVNPETGACPAFMFNHPEDFERYQGDPSKTCISRVWYQNSLPLGRFRILGDPFRDATGRPVAIEVDPEGCSTWGHVNKKVVEQMRQLNPDFDYRSFDRRHNGPNFQFDNSDTAQSRPDRAVDYAIFVYRYDPRWALQPAPGMSRWPGSDGGFAGLGALNLLDPFEDRCYLQEGFTLCKGAGIPTGLLIHEIAHTLYNCPHFQSSNGTVGDFFYPVSAGNSATSPIPFFRTFSAWERWYLGYIEPVADLSWPGSPSEGEYRLRDFLGTGDALRIALPNSDGDQFLWLENHQKRSDLDEHPWAGQAVGPGAHTVPPSAAGVYLTWERVAKTRQQPVQFTTGCNALRPVSAAGNWDYVRLDSSVTNHWGNTLYLYRRGKANPTGGTNPLTSFRDDLNGDGVITVNNHPNMAVNEGRDHSIACEEISPGRFEPLYANFGGYSSLAAGYARPHAFRDGDSITLSTNPLLLETRYYSQRDTGFAPARLSGLSLFFRQSADGDFRVTVKTRQTALYGQVRWSGRLILPDLSEDGRPDLVLAPQSTLRLVKGVVANRHRKAADGGFVNPTVFTVARGCGIRLQRRSRLVVEKGATLVFEPGAFLEKGKRSKLVIKPGGSVLWKQ